jgi:hypothetical protein
MEALIEFGKILLPAGAVLYAMYLVVKMFLSKEMDKVHLELKMKNSEVVLPIRLQAYERVCLFLERITPGNLIVRLNGSSYTAAEFQHILLREIREEFNHNLSQQLYITKESWTLVKNAMEEIVMTINESAGELNQEAKALDLGKVIIDKTVQSQQQGVDFALQHLKEEIAEVF